MTLMSRIYCTSFLDLTLKDKTSLVELTRNKRLSSLSAAKAGSTKITKSALKNIAKQNLGGKNNKMLADPIEAVNKALGKLTEEQIALIISMFPKE